MEIQASEPVVDDELSYLSPIPLSPTPLFTQQNIIFARTIDVTDRGNSCIPNEVLRFFFYDL
jgi:hypothetical protein